MDKEGKQVTKSKFYKIGLGFLIVSLLTWIIPVIAPFTPFSTAVKAGVITGAIVFAEVMFWVGALLVGKEVAAKYKGYLNPKNWRKEKE
ncbi:transporter suffix domain-containing protein [Peribacillus sp. NPDC097895]|uniref:transporter suffix domain-containing protein n=1 Tax=Peribacillus sp. NPDC097895 TaxID=3390619 RepID=UPI003CFCE6E4